jgi:hypothetical protein
MLLAAVAVSAGWQAQAGVHEIVNVDDFRRGEVFCQGFTLKEPMQIDIYAVGAGRKDNRTLSAYGWIIRPNSLEPLWLMDQSNTEALGRGEVLREYDRSFELEPGEYRAYFYAGPSITKATVNIELDGLGDLYKYIVHLFDDEVMVELDEVEVDLDELEEDLEEGLEDLKEELEKLEEREYNLDEDAYRYSRRVLRDYRFEITTDSDAFSVAGCSYATPNTVAKLLEPDHDLYASVGFSLAGPIEAEVMAIGEYSSFNDVFVDHGWLINADTREQVWSMNRRNTRYAGGSRKNRAARQELTLPAGNYILYYVTDDSHAFEDWNAPPPYNPPAYGITVTAIDQADLRLVSSYRDTYSESALISIVELGDDELIQEPFRVNRDCSVRVYAIGEYSDFDNAFVDYGWIIRTDDDRVIWEMDKRNTRHAGGAAKNRLFDDVVHLPAGAYTLGYKTDDSHSYFDWNASPPYDQKNYGVTIFGVGENFDPADIEKLRETPSEANVLAKLTCVGDDADLDQVFVLDQPTRVRVYALGEGVDRKMYDYGWIEDANSGQIIWEMTYRKTRSAGGADKNRMVDDEILLDAGRYRVVYISDDSHSFADWNQPRPRNPFKWGITVTRAEDR